MSVRPGQPERPVAVTPGDFNRDGYLDLAVAFETYNDVVVYYRNTAPISPFTWNPVLPISLSGASGPRDIAAGDVDRDGWLDLVTANYGSTSGSVLRNDTVGSFTQSVTPLVGTPSRVALLDLNHDGLLDLAALDDTALEWSVCWG